ncbi:MULTISPECIES: NAD-dependent succinate-semialdehyde dehydrogenase [unclassified Novosphingobium]|uniref:NAD-dependent succinate-semialdehyde dehydrogenase n=1 Tax=unclassified Novosphingobium TaxID=2644732 RepID=UPI001494DAA9|nr:MULTISPECIES: NAD-dependent succinate-semialdehyde dehydrogenase [unclassified Novosphingobium]MBB3360232.1 succinate-semialdehyde dehydrogenase/glutarate-semialdehyde dehydrogenase [Novosphingobium sp. BK256]MBB3376505.1 succinate-semialdehyde dehydrogenase/glutarate-semialdehyde dehydrogenase [Novosphingobium sp. BK280]MBB3380918.1 succinate-semialdehyde dehydrogenase/glutarate-semialdehyde dehydrogenase [Novosphingobium sp. BK258]MBB3422569.1 succinate-semialdehyde dehydrogenase/glutarate
MSDIVEVTRPALKRPDLWREQAFVAGQWRGAAATIAVDNPATGAVIGQVPDMGAAETREAVDAAQAAFGPWKARTAKERGAVLKRWAALMLEHADDLATIMTAEQGKPLAEAKGEVGYAASFLEWFGEEARRVRGDVIAPHQGDRRLVVTRQPVGVVGAVTPWNFPLAMITRKAGPALAVGCPIVIKPSELTPFSAFALAVLAQEAGLPDGLLSVVTGQAKPIGEVLTGDPRVAKFTFTGSTAVGKLLAAQCAGTVKKVSLELGGNAPFIVFEDADLDAAVEGALASKFRNTGQTCVCANRLLVHDAVYDAFAQKLAARVAAYRVGPGLDGPTDQGPLIDDRAVAKITAHVADAVAKGGKILTGGKPAEAIGARFFEPTVIADVPADALLNREETFGPLAGLIRFSSEQDAVAMANDTRAGLAAYAYTNDAARQWRLTEALEYGMVGINTGLISTEVAPFGGVKESGQGREGSHLGVDDYLDVKLACIAVPAL